MNRGARIWWVALVVAAILLPLDAAAQARPRGQDERRGPIVERRFPPAPRGPIARGVGPRRADPAVQNGYNDGYEGGLDDGLDRRTYDPVRQRWYRQGDRGYSGRYGSRARYENAYRDAFRAGYEAGYRDGRRSNRDREPRGRRGVGIPWPF